MTLPRFASLLGLALATALVSPAAAAASESRGNHGAAVTGHVYVNDNTAGENTIASFDRHPDGSLTPTPGSPFAAGGAGTGKGIGSQGALQRTTNGRYLLAVDAGSNQISVLRIERNGALELIKGGVVASDGVEPVSIAVHRNLVYVANAGAGGTNYTGFRLDPDGEGHLFALPGSTVTLPEDSQPGDVLFNGTGSNLVGVRVNTSLIDSFAVGEDGRLQTAPGSPFKAQGAGPFGSEFRPTDPTQLFVSNAHGGPEAGTVSAFSVEANGELSSIGASPFADHQTAPCWVEISRDGRFLFTVNTASFSISSYSIESSGALELHAGTTLKTASSGPVDARLDPEGDELYVVEAGANKVGGLAVDGGDLSELSSSPVSLPAGAAAFGIVVT